jgi:hypothetical protein
MDTLLLPITPEVVKKLFSSDDLTNDFINNSEYATNDQVNINIVNVAKVLLSYYLHMNKVNDMLSDYTLLLKNNLSPEKKDDIKLRVQLLTYVQSQKNQIDSFDALNDELKKSKEEIERLKKSLEKQGKKSRRKRNTKKSRRKRNTKKSSLQKQKSILRK